MSIKSDTGSSAHRTLSGSEKRVRSIEEWWRYNRWIRFYGIILLGGTKFADVLTTAVGLRYFPAIAEANPFAGHLFGEWGLLTGLTLLGFASVLFAICAAELFGLEVLRRFGLPKTALFAQASIYLTLSLLFGLVAIQNGVLIADQTVYMLDDTLLSSPAIGF
jgi:hypothetical protein